LVITTVIIISEPKPKIPPAPYGCSSINIRNIFTTPLSTFSFKQPVLNGYGRVVKDTLSYVNVGEGFFFVCVSLKV
jgi:hypothetical protein